MTTKTKIISSVVAIVVVALSAYIYFHFFFVYSTGVDAGELNYFQYKGVVFKTYEGKIIQSGFKATSASPNTLRSNEFKFSVTDDAIADSLMRCSGKTVELRWKRYMGTLPWRGESENIVTEVLSVK